MLRKLVEVKFRYDEMPCFHNVLLLEAYLPMNLLFDIKFSIIRIRVKFELCSIFLIHQNGGKQSFELSREKKEQFTVIPM